MPNRYSQIGYPQRMPWIVQCWRSSVHFFPLILFLVYLLTARYRETYDKGIVGEVLIGNTNITQPAGNHLINYDFDQDEINSKNINIT